VITYATGLSEKPAIAWRTLIDSSNNAVSTVIDDARKTLTLSNVYVYSNEIEIADTSVIGTAPGAVWIGDELIAYDRIDQAATISHPNRGFINALRRGARNTSGLPTAEYNTLYYYGDGVNRYFPAESGATPISESVWVDGILQVSNAVPSTIGTYSSVIDPPSLPSGRYIAFNQGHAPRAGWRNVRISALNVEAGNDVAVHAAGSTVIDASKTVRLPNGYNWEAAPQGLQYSNTRQAKFITDHAGTRS